MNILILNMSTLPGFEEITNIYPSTYVVKEELAREFSVENWDQEIRYGSQLEPVPRFLLDALALKGEMLDCIVVLNTQGTLKKRKIRFSGEKLEESAYDFFRRQISKYCKTRGLQEPEYKDEGLVFDEGTREDSSAVEILQANMNAITEAVRFLREKKAENDLHLWLDMHGGLRNTAFLDMAILNLLETEKIYPKMSLTVNLVEKGKYRIEKDDLSPRTLDFTAGLQTFLQYGRAEGLKGYLDKDNVPCGKNSWKFMRIVNDISDAIRICDVTAFEDGIRALKDELSKGHTYEGIIEIFKQTIMDSYGALIDNEENTFNELKWCVDKGFFQQAMVLVEAHMGEYLYKTLFDDHSEYHLKGVCHKKDELTDDEKETMEKKLSQRSWESLECKLFNRWADANALITYLEEEVEGYEYFGTNWKKAKEKAKDIIKVKKVIEKIHELKKGKNEGDLPAIQRLSNCKKPYLLDLEDSCTEEDHLPMYSVVYGNEFEMYLDDAHIDRVKEIKKENYVWIRFELKSPHDTDWRRRLHQFLYLHYVLVGYRNQIMHAARGERIPGDVIQKDLNDYVKLLSGLLD